MVRLGPALVSNNKVIFHPLNTTKEFEYTDTYETTFTFKVKKKQQQNTTLKKQYTIYLPMTLCLANVETKTLCNMPNC